MSAATPVSVPLSASTERSASQRQFDLHHADDLYAIWKSVFERARATEVLREETSRNKIEVSVPRSNVETGADASLGNGANRCGCVSSTSALRGEASLIDDEAVGASADESRMVATSTLSQRHGANDTRAIAAIPPKVSSVSSETVAGGFVTSNARVSVPNNQAAPQSLAAEIHPTVDESVNVFIQNAAVAIVVRDPTLSKQSALHSAFETAHKLTGQRASLQQLILNGRTLYQQSSNSSALGGRSAPALVFAC